MNEIQRLIHEMCPDGVPVGTLGELCTLKARIGWQGLTKKEYRENGDYLLVTGTDFTPDYKIDFNHCVYVDKERYDQDPYIQLKDQDVLITKDGTLGKMAYIDHLPKPTTLNGGVFVIRDKSGKLNQKYMMYYMTSDAFKYMIDKNHTSGSIMHLTQKLLVNFQIPLPPLPIQQRIVEILDKFTSLVSSLDSEIALRQKQYEYYRNKLLSFEEGEEGVEWKKIGDMTRVFSASRVHKNEWKESGVPFFRSSDVMSAYNGVDNNHGKAYISYDLYEKLSAKSGKIHKDDVLVTGGGSIGMPYIVPTDDPLYVKDADLLCIVKNDNFMSKYLYHIMFTKWFRSYLNKITHDASIPHYTISQIIVTPIPIVSKDRQLSIVRTLDTFESLLTNLKKERELRQKQYEYYREKLLTFA